MKKKILSFLLAGSLVLSLAACGSSTPSVSGAAGSDSSEARSSAATMGQKNALRKAKEYLGVMPFSHDGLIKQLEFEGYTSEEAAYGADNCGADWNTQAVKKAKEHLNVMAFSHDGLIKQLEHEAYTPEEAAYGVDNCGADWDAQAAKKAKEYLDIMAFSRDGLIKQLEHEGFTNTQAVHGVTANGY